MLVLVRLSLQPLTVTEKRRVSDEKPFFHATALWSVEILNLRRRGLMLFSIIFTLLSLASEIMKLIMCQA
jgi:hypothetical protein